MRRTTTSRPIPYALVPWLPALPNQVPRSLLQALVTLLPPTGG
jgi:hypothetical protein